MLEVLLCAFAGPLAADQVLVLWDAMIGFDSTLVLALLAVGVVITRQKTLEACENRSQLRVSLLDFPYLNTTHKCTRGVRGVRIDS